MILSMLTLILTSAVSCESIENGWKKIKPLQTERTVAERVLGSGAADDNSYYMYPTEDAYVQVNYSTAPCKANRYERGKFNVPYNTVLDYSVMFKNPPLLSEIRFNREKYVKDTSGDLLDVAAYRNNEDGVDIAVAIEGNREIVHKIYFRPTRKDSEKFVCK